MSLKLSNQFISFTFILFTVIGFVFPSRVFALERNDVLDPRLGVAHVAGNYPDRRIQQDYLTWGGTKAYKLGFNSIEIWMPSNMCFSQSPDRVYQARSKYCEPPPGKWPFAQSLTEFVKQPDFVEMFSQPFQTFFLTAYPLSPGFRNITGTSKLVSGVPYTQNELALLREEYYTFTKYLLETYRNTNKSFAVMPVVTMDRWLSGRDFEDDDSPGACTADDNPPQARINNMITYLQTISSGMRQAKQEASASGVNVYLTCEVNSVICAMEGGIKFGINSVVPFAGCDLVGLAGYELRSLSYTRNDPTLITRTLDYMAAQTPNHPNFGDKNIVISEVGIKEQLATDEQNAWFVNTFLQKILAWGVPHLQLWSLGSCATFNPGPAQQNDPHDCVGMWMFRPDGSPSKLYRFLKNTYGQPVDKNPNINRIGKVDIFDYNLLVGDYGKANGAPGFVKGDINKDGKVDIFDYNTLVANFGK